MAVTSIGVKIGYAPESTKGTRPTTFTFIPSMTSTPSMNPTPETGDTTTFDNKEYKSSIPLLKDLGGSLSFGALIDDTFIQKWEDSLTAFETARTGDMGFWYVIDIPQLAKSVYFKGEPTPLGLPELGVNQVISTEVFITPTGEPMWDTKISSAFSAQTMSASRR